MEQPTQDSRLAFIEEERERETTLALKKFYSQRTPIRLEGIKKLGELHTGLEQLVLALTDRDGTVRAAAVQALGFFDPADLAPGIIDSLLAALDDTSDKVCIAAISTLGRLKVQEAAEEILPFLEDSNPYVVNAAIGALARINPPEIGERLAVFLDSENPHILATAAYAMRLLNYRPAGPVIHARLQELLQTGFKRHPTLFENEIKALGTLGVTAAIPLLIDIAQNQVGFRSMAIQALVELNAEEAVPVLIPMLADPGEQIRKSLIKLIAATRYSAAPVVLRPLLNDSKATIRQAAMLALTELKDTSALEDIRKMSQQDATPFVRTAALKCLCTLLGEGAIPHLVSLVHDTNTAIRRSVAYRLGEMSALPPSAIEALNALAGDPLPDVQLAAQEALAKPHTIIPELPQPQPAPSSLPPILHMDTESLLEALKRWQRDLAAQFAPSNADELMRTDQALSFLIARLEQKHRQEDDV